MRRGARAAVTAVAVALGLVACSGYEVLTPDPGSTPEPGAVIAGDLVDAGIEGSDAASYALGASTMFFTSAALVVLVPDGDDGDLVRAASLATALGAPALVSAEGAENQDALVAELERLETRTVLVVGDAPVPDVSQDRPMLRAVPAPLDTVALQVVIGHDLEGENAVPPWDAVRALGDAPVPTEWLITLAGGPEAASDATPEPGDLAALPGLPSYEATVRATGALLVTGSDLALAPAVGTARAAGADVLVLEAGLPPMVSQALEKSSDVVLSLGAQAEVLGTPEEVAYLARVATAGVELPGGGLTLLPGKEYLALRGLPGVPELGPLGAGVEAGLERLTEEGRAVAPGVAQVIPTLELVATVATAEPGAFGAYSAPQPSTVLREAIAAARAADAMVLLSFQPGRDSFDSQLRAYAELLEEPNVGILLEPQWRLDQNETPEDRSGAIGDDEVVAAAQWLADFTRERSLPPKLVAVRDPLGPSAFALARPEVALVVVVDGDAVAPEVPGAPGTDPAAPPPVPAVTAEQVWEDAVVPGPPWWGWDQGANAVPIDELLALSPRPVLVTLR